MADKLNVCLMNDSFAPIIDGECRYELRKHNYIG